MQKTTLEEIHKRLDQIQADLEEKQRICKANREACETVIHFITETINNIAPQQIEAHWYGSYTNSGVADYPVLTIVASHIPTHTSLGKWKVDAGGKYQAPVLTQDEIASTVLQELNKINVTTSW